MSEIDDLDALESGSFVSRDTRSTAPARRLEDAVATTWPPRALPELGTLFGGEKTPDGAISALKRAQMALLVGVASGENDAAVAAKLDRIRAVLAAGRDPSGESGL